MAGICSDYYKRIRGAIINIINNDFAGQELLLDVVSRRYEESNSNHTVRMYGLRVYVDTTNRGSQEVPEVPESRLGGKVMAVSYEVVRKILTIVREEAGAEVTRRIVGRLFSETSDANASYRETLRRLKSELRILEGH